MRGALICFLLMLPVVGAQSPEAITSGLLTVKRIHVEELSGDETADQIRDMLIASVQRTGIFVLTEDAARADAILRGSAEDLIYTETHDTQDSINARGSVNLSPSGSSSSSRSRSRFYVSTQVGENEGSRTVERKHEAMAAVRLVNAKGDIIWSTLQESTGAKLRSASADVALKVTKQLVKDYELETGKRARPPVPSATGGPRPPSSPRRKCPGDYLAGCASAKCDHARPAPRHQTPGR